MGCRANSKKQSSGPVVATKYSEQPASVRSESLLIALFSVLRNRLPVSVQEMFLSNSSVRYNVATIQQVKTSRNARSFKILTVFGCSVNLKTVSFE